MGVLWTVWPLSDEMKAWLDECGVEYQDESSRLPTGREIKRVVASLDAFFDIEINDNGIGGSWHATIVAKSGGDTGEWTLLHISDYTGDDDEQQLWFEKGWESLIVRILKDLATSTGTLVLLPDTGNEPQVITSAR